MYNFDSTTSFKEVELNFINILHLEAFNMFLWIIAFKNLKFIVTYKKQSFKKLKTKKTGTENNALLLKLTIQTN